VTVKPNCNSWKGNGEGDLTKSSRDGQAKSSQLEPPLRRVSHEERVSLGEKVAADLVARYKAVVLAVLIVGSTAKKLERPYSDLEMLCVFKDGLEVPPMKYLAHNGLLVEVEFSQESKLLEDARKVSMDWPWYADQYRNRIVLFEKDGWLTKLDQAVAENDKADFTEAIRIAALAMTESLAAVRNAEYVKDRVALRSGAYWMAMDTAKLVLLLNRRYVLTTSWFWKQAFECPQRPEDFRKLIDTAAGFVDSTDSERVEAVEKLWKQTIKLVLARGISIESTKLAV
jgi:kanamycin nucleotidyltransferase